jgi:hypothetical protein
MVQKRKRKELYDKFRQGAIPSGADFADFIRSQLNLLDDGLDISEDPKEPICFRAHGDEDNILDLADKDGLKRWRISGRNEDGSKEGLNIKADNRSRFYIERETGNIGVSTDQPQAKLHIIQLDSGDAFRIDDVGNDETPFVITSDGQVGIGTGAGNDRPKAKLHISHSGAGDVLRVDDARDDTTPLIINEDGKVGIGCDEPQAKLTVNGGVIIGQLAPDEGPPSGSSLYVEGNIEVGGSIVVSGNMGGLEINGPLTAKTGTVKIMDNVEIVSGTSSDPEDSSDGNLKVEGDTTLGTYNSDPIHYKVVTVNGKIVSGGIPDSSENQQYELEINEKLTVNRNRDPKSPGVSINGNFSVAGNSNLGNNQGGDYIYLDGTVQRTGDEPVTIDDNLTVTQNAAIKSLKLNSGATVNKISTEIPFESSVPESSSTTIPTEKAVKEYIDNLLVGSIAAFAMPVVPDGWLECNGQAVSREGYARLFKRINVTYGSGDGDKTFNLPNLRNQFLRGHLPNVRNISKDPQSDAIRSHNHPFSGNYTTISGGSHSHVHHSSQIWGALIGYSWRIRGLASFSFNADWGYFLHYDPYGTTWSESHTHGYTPVGSVGNSGSNETRPENMAVMFCIKY